MRCFQLLTDLDDPRAALDRVINMKDQMWSVFQDDVPGQFRLQTNAMDFESTHYAVRIVRSHHAHEHEGILHVWRNVHVVDTDKGGPEADFPGNYTAELS